MVQILEKYGWIGVAVALGTYIMLLHKMQEKREKKHDETIHMLTSNHIEERKEWKEIAKTGFENVKENTSIISSLKTLFEHHLHQL